MSSNQQTGHRTSYRRHRLEHLEGRGKTGNVGGTLEIRDSGCCFQAAKRRDGVVVVLSSSLLSDVSIVSCAEVVPWQGKHGKNAKSLFSAPATCISHFLLSMSCLFPPSSHHFFSFLFYIRFPFFFFFFLPPLLFLSASFASGGNKYGACVCVSVLCVCAHLRQLHRLMGAWLEV